MKLLGSDSSRKEGSALIMVALSLSIILSAGSLCLDYGYLVLMRWRLQTAVDAAALGGAYELAGGLKSLETREAAAEFRAIDIGRHNLSATYAVSFPDQRSCRVLGDMDVRLFFAEIMGMPTRRISAVAEAGISSVSSASGVRPFGVEDPEGGFLFGGLYYLKLGAGDPDYIDGVEPASHGNFHALAVGGTGASVYRSNIKFGSEESIHLFDWLDTEPGNMSGPTEDGVDYILQQEITEEGVEYLMAKDHISWEWYSAHPDELASSPRVITVPVIGNWANVYGRSEVQVVGFARMFLEGVDGRGRDCRVRGRFVEGIVPGSSGNGDASYGAFAVRLVR